MMFSPARFITSACLAAGCLCGPAWSGQIVYPWNATTAIAEDGEAFEIWYDADPGQRVESVVLRGPYHSVAVTSLVQEAGSWIYDPVSGNTCDIRIKATVPPGTPTDRYDLVLTTSLGVEVSRRAVRVIREYPDEYSIFHISDTHMCQGAVIDGYPERLLKVSALVEMANIIGPELIFITGDLINNNMFPPRKRSAFFYDGAEEHGVQGVHGFDAATFSTVGNHDFLEGEQPGSGHYPEKARFWNRFHGLQDHRFTYGRTRCMIVNDGWNGFDWTYQLVNHAGWLDEVGPGRLRVAAYHKSEMGIMGEWANTVDLGLALIGHNHHLAGDNPYELGGRPIQYYANSVREYINFNLFRVRGDGSFTALNNLAAVENPDDTPAAWRPRLTRTYARANDGTQPANTATLVNRFDVGFPRARVRFVMPKPGPYAISQGEVEQAFDGDEFHIIDLRVSLAADTTTTVEVKKP